MLFSPIPFLDSFRSDNPHVYGFLFCSCGRMKGKVIESCVFQDLVHRSSRDAFFAHASPGYLPLIFKKACRDFLPRCVLRCLCYMWFLNAVSGLACTIF
ncbi:hypothetical protein AKJ16_DCAP14293 [Drosera capensis]